MTQYKNLKYFDFDPKKSSVLLPKEAKPKYLRRTRAVGNIHDGREVFIRDNHVAARIFGIYNSALERLPRLKFLFFVTFVIPSRKNFGQPYSGWDTGVSLAVRSITRPNFSFDVQLHKQYNKWRLSQHGVSYGDVTITLYDTQDQRVFKMLKDYFEFYYGDATDNPQDWVYDITTQEYMTPSNDKEDFGFNYPNTIPENSYFFDRIEVYEFNGKKYNKYNLIKPKIRNISYDTNDYGDSSPQIITLTVAYEGIVWDVVNGDVEEQLLEISGRNMGDFNDIPFNGLQLDRKTKKGESSLFGSSSVSGKRVKQLEIENVNFGAKTSLDTVHKRFLKNSSAISTLPKNAQLAFKKPVKQYIQSQTNQPLQNIKIAWDKTTEVFGEINKRIDGFLEVGKNAEQVINIFGWGRKGPLAKVLGKMHQIETLRNDVARYGTMITKVLNESDTSTLGKVVKQATSDIPSTIKTIENLLKK